MVKCLVTEEVPFSALFLSFCTKFAQFGGKIFNYPIRFEYSCDFFVQNRFRRTFLDRFRTVPNRLRQSNSLTICCYA